MNHKRHKRRAKGLYRNIYASFVIHVIILYFTSFSIQSQIINSDKNDISPVLSKNSILLDIGGIGGYGSLNYEYSFFEKKNIILSSRIGFSFFRFKDFERKFNPDLLFPLSIQLRKKWKNHAVLVGVGQTISSIVKTSNDFSRKIRKNRLNGNLSLGYRFQKKSKPFFFQITYTPLFERYERFRHWGGLGVGYNL